MKHLLLLLLFSGLLCTAQSQTREEKRIFTGLINEQKSFGNELRWNGYFNNENSFLRADPITPQNIRYVTKDTLLSAAPVFFFKNGIVGRCNFAIYHSQELINSVKDSLQLTGKRVWDWGTYEIDNDTMKIALFEKTWYWTPDHRHILTYYQGVIQNDSTIVDWHPVAPISKNKRFLDQITFKPTRLTFVKFEEKNQVDSSKAWVNKYRK